MREPWDSLTTQHTEHWQQAGEEPPPPILDLRVLRVHCSAYSEPEYTPAKAS